MLLNASHLCKNVAMPNIDPGAKRWQEDLAARVGRAVKRARKDLGWTAIELSRRCTDLGFPMSRVAISKIESNSRAGKLDLAELIVLAEALDVPPVALIYPYLPAGEVEVLPGHFTPSSDAVWWFTGESDSPKSENSLSYLLALTRRWYRYLIRLERADELLEVALRNRGQVDRDDFDLLHELMDDVNETERQILRVPGSWLSDRGRGLSVTVKDEAGDDD